MRKVVFIVVAPVVYTLLVIAVSFLCLENLMRKDEHNHSTLDDESGMLLEHLNGPLAANNQQLVDYVRKNFVVLPSKDEYNMETNVTDTSMGQAEAVVQILHDQKNGFFVECGALDGETRSNTYFMERQLGWQGVLIEGDPKNFEILLTKNRKAFAVPACIAPHPQKVLFHQNFNQGKIADPASNATTSSVMVQCFPLWTVLLALNRTTVDYLSLDVEGDELNILRTLPFDLVNIRVMSVEWKHVPEGKDGLQRFVESQGYKVVTEVVRPNNLANDFIFVKKS